MTNRPNGVATGENTLSRMRDLIMKRDMLAQEILQSVKEGNEYQTQRGFEARCELELPHILADGLGEWKYDLAGLEYLLMHYLGNDQTIQPYLAGIHTEFLEKLDQAEAEGQCMEAAQTALLAYCRLNKDVKLQNYSALTQKVVLAVDMDLTRPLTLQYFAEVLSVNSSYLSDLFHREVGMTITDYVTAKRISHAKSLLAFSQNPIKTVAKLAGIPDVQYFSKIFKRKTGMTPSQYRKEQIT